MGIVNFDNDVCALTDKGLVRPHNEDSNRVERTTNGDLFVVCDGMGGHVGGATASRMGVDSICQYVKEHECGLPQQFLVQALEYANKRVFSESRANPNLKGMGTTACVALVRDDKVWYAHVGDSRIYYFNAKNKSLYRLTKDHSVVQALVDQGMITEAEAEHHPEKNKIRKALGIKETVEPEPCQMPLLPAEGDVLLICSDGLSGMMDEDDILEVLITKDNINEAGKVLIELAKSGGGTDNITVQLIRFSGIGEREAVFDARNMGVSSSTITSGKKSKSKWPLLLMATSVAVIILAIGTLFGGKGYHENNQEPIKDSITEIVADKPQATPPAYEKYTKGREPDGEYENDWIFYKDIRINNKTVKYLFVNTKTHQWQYGDYQINNDGSYYPLKVTTRDKDNNIINNIDL